ncbi:MAG: chemotaxis protein CheW [Anaerolineales bacterium]|nr:chemotaxis protein CheW [Anaerolineales bacterium]
MINWDSSHNSLGMMATGSITILTFQMNGQVYGLPVTAVRQLIEMVKIAELPQAPPAIQGVINVHGQIVPVMDLRLCFGLEFKPYGLRTPIILLEANGRMFGLVVDEVATVLTVNSIDIQTSNKIIDQENIAAPGQTNYLSSVAKINNQIVMILDVDCLLSQEQASKLTQLFIQQQIEPNTEAAKNKALTGV